MFCFEGNIYIGIIGFYVKVFGEVGVVAVFVDVVYFDIFLFFGF